MHGLELTVQYSCKVDQNLTIPVVSLQGGHLPGAFCCVMR